MHAFTMFQGTYNKAAPYSMEVLSLADYVCSGKNEFFLVLKFDQCIIKHLSQ